MASLTLNLLDFLPGSCFIDLLVSLDTRDCLFFLKYSFPNLYEETHFLDFFSYLRNQINSEDKEYLQIKVG